MSKSLIIAEKPSVAEDIAKALGGFTKTRVGFERSDIIVSAAAGHLATVEAPGADKTGKSLDTLPIVPSAFNVVVIDDERVRPRFQMLKELMARPDVSTVVNACDAGREGELIFRLIFEAAGCRKPSARMWLQSMTQGAIKEAFAQMRPAAEYDRLADAARCRAESDWLVGINGTRGVSLLHEAIRGAYALKSVGRVQTPTLAIIVDLEDKIRNFKPTDYFEIHGTFGAAAGDYAGRWYSPAAGQGQGGEDDGSAGYRIMKKELADAIVAKCRGVSPTSVKDETKPAVEQPPKLFDLTTLQREANKKFKLSAADTLKIAQSLYERHKVTTYPRTDASALPEDYVDTAKQTLGALQGTPYASFATKALENGWVKPNKRIFDDTKISDHFAIIPTGVVPQGLSDVEQRVYDMVVRRFIAAFYPAAEYLETTRVTVVASEQFRSSGRVLRAEGWKAVYGTSSEDDPKQPSLALVAPGERVVTKDIAVKALKTKAPKRLTEAGLLSAMERAGKLVEDDELSEAMAERGLGTPATRAAIIENLLSTKGAKGKPKEPYIIRESNMLVPTPSGMEVIHFLRENGIGALTSPAMTGEWEHKLAMMEAGKYTRDRFMAEIAGVTRDMIASLCGRAPKVEQVLIPVPCPKCGGAVKGGVSSYTCQNACGIALKRTLLGRAITAEECASLLRDRITAPLAGFVSPKSGKPFGAMLVLTSEWKIEFEFPKADDPAVLAAAPKLKQPCPKCRGVMRATDRTFACETGDFNFYRTISNRRMTDEEADYLIERRITPKCGGFFSTKKNKAFLAAYELNAGLEVKLVFS